MLFRFHKMFDNRVFLFSYLRHIVESFGTRPTDEYLNLSCGADIIRRYSEHSMSSSWELSVPADLFDEALKEVLYSNICRLDSYAGL